MPPLGVMAAMVSTHDENSVDEPTDVSSWWTLSPLPARRAVRAAMPTCKLVDTTTTKWLTIDIIKGLDSLLDNFQLLATVPCVNAFSHQMCSRSVFLVVFLLDWVVADRSLATDACPSVQSAVVVLLPASNCQPGSMGEEAA